MKVPPEVIKEKGWTIARWDSDMVIVVMPMTFGKGRLVIGYDYNTYERGY